MVLLIQWFVQLLVDLLALSRNWQLMVMAMMLVMVVM